MDKPRHAASCSLSRQGVHQGYLHANLLVSGHTTSVCAEGEEFAPNPNELTLSLEHRVSHEVWHPLELTMLGLLQVQGPFVHEGSVPQAIAAQELRLRVLNWPMYYKLSLPDLASQSAFGPTMLLDPNVFRNAVVIGDMHGTDVTTAAQILATHMAHHFALGFDMYLIYVRGSELSTAISANSVTEGYVTDGKLRIISLDELQIPMYDSGFTWAAYDPTKLIAYNHAALMLWGERFHLTVIDIDEMWSSKDASSTVNSWFDSCFPGSYIISASRVDMVCNDCLEQGLSELDYFKQNWRASDPTEVLQSFSKVVDFNSDPKSVFYPDKVGQVWLHHPFRSLGSEAALVVVSDESFDLTQDCVFVVHLRNLFETRIDDAHTAVDRHHWLVHKHRNRP